MRTTTSSSAHLARAAVLTVTAVLAMTGCADSAAPDPAPSSTRPSSDEADDRPTTEPATEPTPTAEPSDTGGVLDLSDDANGIFFAELPDVTGEEAAVLNAANTYNLLDWRALQANAIPAELPGTVAPPVLTYLESQVTRQVENGSHLGGEVTFTSTVVELAADVAVVETCVDQTGMTIVRADGTSMTSAEAGSPATALVTLTLAGGAGAWAVSGYSDAAAPC